MPPQQGFIGQLFPDHRSERSAVVLGCAEPELPGSADFQSNATRILTLKKSTEVGQGYLPKGDAIIAQPFQGGVPMSKKTA